MGGHTHTSMGSIPRIASARERVTAGQWVVGRAARAAKPSALRHACSSQKPMALPGDRIHTHGDFLGRQSGLSGIWKVIGA